MSIDDEDYLASTTFQYDEDDEPPETRPPTGATGMLLRPVLKPDEAHRVAALDAREAREAVVALPAISPAIVATAPAESPASLPLIKGLPPVAPGPHRVDHRVDQALVDTTVRFEDEALAPAGAKSASSVTGRPAATHDDPAGLVGRVFAGRFAVERSSARGTTYVRYEATQLGRGRRVPLVVVDPRAHPCEGPALEALRAHAQRLAAGGNARVLIEAGEFPSGLRALWFCIDTVPVLKPDAERAFLSLLLAPPESLAQGEGAAAVPWFKRLFSR